MNNTLRKAFTLLLCLGFCLCVASSAWAAEPESQTYPDDVIVGFEGPDSPIVIDTPYKYALIEMERNFPHSSPFAWAAPSSSSAATTMPS